MKHTGEFMDILPTVKIDEMTNTDIYRIAHGKLAEWWGGVDILHVVQQLGAIPSQ